MEKPLVKPGAFKALLALHKTLLSGQIILALGAFFLVYSNTHNKGVQFPDRLLQAVSVVFSIGGFYLGTFLFKRKLIQLSGIQLPAKEKFTIYRYAYIIRWALLEVPCLFVIICFLITGNYAFFALAVVLMLLFARYAPSMVKTVTQLQLSEEEILVL